MKIAGIIPCRFGAVRFPGKPLVDIMGKPMMWHVYQRAMACNLLDQVLIATDDNRIIKVCDELKLNSILTRNDHITGTDRVAECAMKIQADIYVNVQGDEPMIEPSAIAAVTSALIKNQDDSVQVSNAYVPFTETSDVVDTNNVKVVVSKSNHALFYSRQPIPFPKGCQAYYLRQLGLYAFTAEGLAFFSSCRPGPVECAEGVEMLRYLEDDKKVLMVEVEDRSIPVDTESDLKRVVSLMKLDGKKN